MKLTKKNIKIVYSKLVQTEPIPTNGIIFNELIETVGLNLSDLIVHDVDPKKDVPILPYSSGTTGMPKGVRLSHYNLVANCQMANCVFESGSIYSETADDFQESIPCVLPYSHIYGLTVSLLSKLQVGCKMVALPFFRPDTFLNALSEHKATVLLIVPPIGNSIIKLKIFQQETMIFISFKISANFLANYKLEKKHTEHLKLAICGASPITQAEAEQYVKNIPNCTFSQGYGLTEASPVAFMCYDRSRTSFETIGRPLPLMAAKVTAVNDTSYRGLGPNISGEILVRGPNVMQGNFCIGLT